MGFPLGHASEEKSYWSAQLSTIFREKPFGYQVEGLSHFRDKTYADELSVQVIGRRYIHHLNFRMVDDLLPIRCKSFEAEAFLRFAGASLHVVRTNHQARLDRSEERRVGKECRL